MNVLKIGDTNTPTIGKYMYVSFEETYKISEERHIPLRTAAYLIAVSRIAKAIELRGIFP